MTKTVEGYLTWLYLVIQVTTIQLETVLFNADYVGSKVFGRVSISNAKCMGMGLEFFSLQLIMRIDMKLLVKC